MRNNNNANSKLTESLYNCYTNSISGDYAGTPMSGEKPWYITSCISMSILVIGMYVITGLLGLQLATGSAYSTPIWIPSGIALGAALICGYATLPGIFLGSMFVNFIITLQDPSVTNLSYPFVIGAIIATGAILQALVGFLW